MNIDEKIELEDREIGLENLFLDPNNPRIHVGGSNNVSDEDIDDSDVQASTFEKMIRGFEIKSLMQSIKSKGFITIDSVFVREIGKNKYVVLEGNRRLTSIKELLKNHNGKKAKDKLSKELLETLKKIPCKILKNPTQNKIDYILGIRHQSGPLQWGPIQRANGCYKRYCIEYQLKHKKDMGDIGDFIYEIDLARKVADTFNLTPTSVKNALRNYVVFHQMKTNGYNLNETDYSFFEEAFKKQTLRDNFFKQDDKKFTLEEEARENFWELCNFKNKDEESPLKMAIHFREFGKIYDNDNDKKIDKNINRVLKKGEPAPEVWSDVHSANIKSSWLDSLEIAHQKLKSGFDIEEFRGSVAEMNWVNKIDSIIKKLKKISTEK
jgi:hypothetical protein